MLIYWVLFCYFAFGAALSVDYQRGKMLPPALLFGAAATCVIIGLRYKVGGDWDTYELWFKFAKYTTFDRLLSYGDPAYQLLNWLTSQLGGEIWLVNLICAIAFTWGLFRFCHAQPDPWLAVLVSIPYLVIVVAMGYTRQAVALGILMGALATKNHDLSVVRYAFHTAIASTFHKTAVITFPLVAVLGQRNRVTNLLMAAAAGILLYDLFLSNSMDTFIRNYIMVRYASQGAAIRVAMNFLAAIAFLVFRNRLQFSPFERKIWRNFSLAAVGLVILFLAIPSSTAVDRISLYLIPLQIAVISRIPAALGTPLVGKALIIAYAGIVQFVWLNFAQHSRYWVPYHFYPIVNSTAVTVAAASPSRYSIICFDPLENQRRSIA